MIKIYLVRHGQDTDNAKGILNGRRDEPLSEKGIEQANEVANKIKESGIHFDHVYSSPLQRAYKTAEIITYTLGINRPEVLEDLIERARKVLSGIKSKHKDGNILLVTHGDFGKMIYTAYYNLDWKEVLTMFHFGNSELLELSEESGPKETHVFKIQQYNHLFSPDRDP